MTGKSSSVTYHGETVFRCPDCKGVVPLSRAIARDKKPSCPDCETRLNHLVEANTEHSEDTDDE